MPGWDQLRLFGRSRLVQSTIVVPVIGYTILFSAEYQSYFSLFFEAENAGQLPGRLYWLYYGFSALAVGSLIFNVRCPAEVKHHGAAYDFVTKQMPIMHAHRETAMQERILVNYFLFAYPNSKYDFVTAAEHPDTPDGRQIENLVKIRRELFDVNRRIGEQSREEIMRDYFEILEDSRPSARLFTTVSYAVGVIALAVPTIQTFYSVTKYLISPVIGK